MSAIDLVERLRRKQAFLTNHDGLWAHDPVNPDGPEAADTITRLQAALRPFARLSCRSDYPHSKTVQRKVLVHSIREAREALRSSVGGE